MVVEQRSRIGVVNDPCGSVRGSSCRVVFHLDGIIHRADRAGGRAVVGGGDPSKDLAVENDAAVSVETGNGIDVGSAQCGVEQDEISKIGRAHV